MKNKLENFIYNNINSISFGFLNGFIIFIGIFLLSKYFLIPSEIEFTNNQILDNSLLYIPYYLLSDLQKQEIILFLNIFKKMNSYDKKKEQEIINNENKNVNNNITIIIVIFFIIILILLFINYKFYKNIKYFNLNLINTIITGAILIFFEYIIMQFILLKYYYINMNDIFYNIKRKLN